MYARGYAWQNSAMFDIVVASGALRQLRRLRRIDGVRILDAIESHLRHEPERPTRTAVKRLRGRQDATYRRCVGVFRVFYDFEARNNFSRTLDAARTDVVVVTRNGKPVAAIQGIDDADVEDLLLERSEKFWTMIARARAGKAVSLETARRRLAKHSTPRRRRPAKQ